MKSLRESWFSFQKLSTVNLSQVWRLMNRFPHNARKLVGLILCTSCAVYHDWGEYMSSEILLMLRRHCFDQVLSSLWLLQSFGSLFTNGSSEVARYRYPTWGWALHCHSFSAPWPLPSFLVNYHPLHKEVSLMRLLWYTNLHKRERDLEAPSYYVYLEIFHFISLIQIISLELPYTSYCNHRRSLKFPNKKAHHRWGISPLKLLLRGVLETLKTTQSIEITLGYQPNLSHDMEKSSLLEPVSFLLSGYLS